MIRRTPLKRSGRIKPKPRSASEFQRIYGSRERVAFVKALPCIVSWCPERPSENHHIENGGTGRKADADKIIPLCLMHHEHYHHIGRRTFEFAYGLNLDNAAAETERLWLAHTQRSTDDAA